MKKVIILCSALVFNFLTCPEASAYNARFEAADIEIKLTELIGLVDSPNAKNEIVRRYTQKIKKLVNNRPQIWMGTGDLKIENNGTVQFIGKFNQPHQGKNRSGKAEAQRIISEIQEEINQLKAKRQAEAQNNASAHYSNDSTPSISRRFSVAKGTHPEPANLIPWSSQNSSSGQNYAENNRIEGKTGTLALPAPDNRTEEGNSRLALPAPQGNSENQRHQVEEGNIENSEPYSNDSTPSSSRRSSDSSNSDSDRSNESLSNASTPSSSRRSSDSSNSDSDRDSESLSNASTPSSSRRSSLTNSESSDNMNGYNYDDYMRARRNLEYENENSEPYSNDSTPSSSRRSSDSSNSDSDRDSESLSNASTPSSSRRSSLTNSESSDNINGYNYDDYMRARRNQEYEEAQGQQQAGDQRQQQARERHEAEQRKQQEEEARAQREAEQQAQEQPQAESQNNTSAPSSNDSTPSISRQSSISFDSNKYPTEEEEPNADATGTKNGEQETRKDSAPSENNGTNTNSSDQNFPHHYREEFGDFPSYDLSSSSSPQSSVSSANSKFSNADHQSDSSSESSSNNENGSGSTFPNHYNDSLFDN